MQTFDIQFVTSYSDRLELEQIQTQDPSLFVLQQRFYDMHENQYSTLDPRFYQHDTEGSFSKLEFQQLLGPDTMPGFHPVVQLGVIRNFRLLPYELGTVAITHDWGELAVGDDIYSENPDETKKDIETQRRRSYIERMFQPNGADISSLVDIALDPSTDLGIQFKISERLGYMRTILRAYALSLEFEKLRNFEKKNEVLRSIASHALFHIDPLGKASDSNPKILEFLERNANAIDSIQRNFDKPNDPVKPQ